MDASYLNIRRSVISRYPVLPTQHRIRSSVKRRELGKQGMDQADSRSAGVIGGYLNKAVELAEFLECRDRIHP